MDLVNYLVNIYGYDTPIFLKDIRIGGKSKASIKEDFYRACKKGLIERDSNGIYFIKSKEEFGGVITFEEIIKRKYIYEEFAHLSIEDFFICGYYSGQTFLNMIGISNQVPAKLEVTTNRTSSKKRIITIDKMSAIIRRGKTKIDYKNYKMLQFLDMFHFLTFDEVKENKELIIEYAKRYLSPNDFQKYIGLYGVDTIKKITEGGIINAFIG